ncbi:hypothetical protein ACKWTF_004242 [Chironomus riparius]
MKIPTVDGCCCFGLETAGKILGWLGIIFGSITIISILIGIGFLATLSCDDLEESDEFKKVTEDYSLPDCAALKTAIIVALVIFLIICLISTFIDVLLIRGIQTRNPGKLIPSVVFQAIGTVSSIIRELLAFSMTGVLRAVVIGGFMFYIFLVLYSLYVRIRNEQRTIRNVRFSNLKC